MPTHSLSPSASPTDSPAAAGTGTVTPPEAVLREDGARAVLSLPSTEVRRPDGTVVEVPGVEVDVTTVRHAVVERQVQDAVAASRAHRGDIERAKGVVMLEHGVDEDTAFAVLRRLSNATNLKLREVAAGVVQGRGIVAATAASGTATRARDAVD